MFGFFDFMVTSFSATWDRSLILQTMIRVVPLLARFVAMILPIPEFAPVTMQTLLSRSWLIGLFVMARLCVKGL